VPAGLVIVLVLVLDWAVVRRVAACAYPGSANVWCRLTRSDAKRWPSQLIRGYFGSLALPNDWIVG
jgi:hypothetical protein